MARFSADLASIFSTFSVPEGLQQKLLASNCLEVWQFAEYVDNVSDWTGICAALEPPITDRTLIAAVRRAFKAACQRDTEVLTRGHAAPGEDVDAPIDPSVRRTLVDAHGRHYHFPLQGSRQPSGTLLGRLHREKFRCTHTVFNIARVASWASQGVHTKHFDVLPGLSVNVCAPADKAAAAESKSLNCAQWLRNLRVLYNGYAIVGLEKAKGQDGTLLPWCSWPLVSHFVDLLSDLATTNIPGTNQRPPLASLQFAELSFRTRVVELLRTILYTDIPYTFDEAFNIAMAEK